MKTTWLKQTTVDPEIKQECSNTPIYWSNNTSSGLHPILILSQLF